MAQTLKNLPAMWETQAQSLGWEDPWEKGMTTHSVFLPGESHGQRSLMGYSPQGHKSRTRNIINIYYITSIALLFSQEEDPLAVAHGQMQLEVPLWS